MFTCPFCDGFEHRDTHLAVVGAAPFVPHIAQLLRTNWSPLVTVFHDGLDDEARRDLVAHGVAIDARAVARVVGDGGRVTALSLADGAEVPVGEVIG